MRGSRPEEAKGLAWGPGSKAGRELGLDPHAQPSALQLPAASESRGPEKPGHGKEGYSGMGLEGKN